jgi:hypothetical protein
VIPGRSELCIAGKSEAQILRQRRCVFYPMFSQFAMTYPKGQRRERFSSVRMQGFVNEGPKDGRAKVLLSLGEL